MGLEPEAARALVSVGTADNSEAVVVGRHSWEACTEWGEPPKVALEQVLALAPMELAKTVLPPRSVEDAGEWCPSVRLPGICRLQP